MLNREDSEAQQRELREAVNTALMEYGSYTKEEVDTVMACLDDAGIKCTSELSRLDHSCLHAGRVKPAMTSILLKKFTGHLSSADETAPGSDEKEESRRSRFLGPWQITAYMVLVLAVTAIAVAVRNKKTVADIGREFLSLKIASAVLNIADAIGNP
ncbi:hypothetical protein V5799_014751 [Amblyomma americanum]|uniref:Uncharacterized protein n=1 Tax=Amblyomma americanum TaxID=6943 RepID=A0AAQ4E245_AMBAM